MSKRFASILIITIVAIASLAAQGTSESSSPSCNQPYLYMPSHPIPSLDAGEWFSLGFGLGSNVLTAPLQNDGDFQAFSSLSVDAEFTMLPQASVGNAVLRISFGTLQQQDIFGRTVLGGTIDATLMYRWQHSSGFALGVGAGCFVPGFFENAKPSPEAVLEPSFAFNLAYGHSASTGVIRIAAPLEARFDIQSSQWYLNVGISATFYVI